MIKRLFLLLTPVVVLLAACSDDDTFSTDSSHTLTFASDTIRMDTLFTTIPSSTYNFWAFNRSGDGIRIRSVRLERGSQSGFRVNVDGTFLNPVATDLEVRKGDSLRVFVEMTAHENLQPEPKEIDDNLLFTLESGVEQRVNLRAVTWNAQKLTNLVVNNDTVIESSTPIVIYGSGIQVGKDATLTIKSSRLYFHDGAGITVAGRLVADNTLFRGDRLDHMFDYLPYDRVSGQWRGITIAANAAGCELTNSEIRSSNTGLYCDSTVVSLTNTVIHNCKGFGLYAHDSEVVLDSCQLTNTLNDCLALMGCEAFVRKTTLAQFYPLSASRGAALRFGHTEQPVVLVCSQVLATGYADDVVMGEAGDADNTAYLFQDCLLRTPAVADEEAFKDVIWEKSTDAIQGLLHFMRVDATNFIYDFTIKPDSPAFARGIGRCATPEPTPEPEPTEP